MSELTFIPAVFYKDPRAALTWLEKAFGFETTMVIEPADGDGNDLGTRGIEGGDARLGRGVLTGTHHKPRLEGLAGDSQYVIHEQTPSPG